MKTQVTAGSPARRLSGNDAWVVSEYAVLRLLQILTLLDAPPDMFGELDELMLRIGRGLSGEEVWKPHVREVAEWLKEWDARMGTTHDEVEPALRRLDNCWNAAGSRFLRQVTQNPIRQRELAREPVA